MRFEVPQFIDIEDKIFGPLTWRQFLYLGGGVGMAIVMFITLPFLAFVLIGLPLGILAGALAFYPVNNRPFSFFLEALFNYASGQRLYLWNKKTEQIYRKRAESTPDGLTQANTVRRKPKKDIASLSRKLELQALQKTE
jgi:hypothetical protein